MFAQPFVVSTSSHLTAAAIAGLWQGAALALLAAVLLRLTPRASATLRHFLLVAIFAIAAVLPWLHFGTAHGQAVSARTITIPPWFAITIAAAWIVLACARAVSLIHAWNHLRGICRRAKSVTFAGTDQFTAGDRTAQLYTSPDIDSPTIIGFRAPRLLLPDWMMPLLTPEDLRRIALHECEHLCRYDDWSNLLLRMFLIVSPLNPSLLWLDARIGTQRELACDAAVVASTGEPIAYATCLTRLAEQRTTHRRLALALAAWSKQSELGQRVQALLSHTSVWTQRQSLLAGYAASVVLLAGTAFLARTQPFVHVMDPSGNAHVAAAHPLTILVPSAHTPSGTVLDTYIPAGDRLSSGMHTVPASFEINPTGTKSAENVWLQTAHALQLRRNAALDMKRKSMRQHGQRKYSTHTTKAERFNPAIQTWFARTNLLHTNQNAAEVYRIEDIPHVTFNTHNLTSPGFATTELTSTYLAVPVARGWLILYL